MKCRNHTGAYLIRSAAIFETGTLLLYRMYGCARCGELIDPEPSNDDSDAVRHEIKLAACIADVCQLWEPRHQNELTQRYVDGFSSQPIEEHDDSGGEL